MRVTIDNLDGAGAVDYSGAVCADHPLKIERVLNTPSRCSGMLNVSAGALAVPARRGRMVVTTDSGNVLFTGYIATEPERVYAGVATMGPVYRYAFSAISDEWLLDKQSSPLSGGALAQAGGQVLKTLTHRVESGLFTTAGVLDGHPVGVFEPVQTESWSANAGQLAGATYAAYRVLNGALTMQPAGTVTHALSDGDGTLQIAALKTAAVKELANDVTVSGEIEPAAYIAETFAGDGTTTAFQLAEAPFRPRKAANSSRLLDDSFNEAAFDTRVWQ
ncbi:MAG: hypothetical protein ABI158_15045, partial [Edaphobacter sp.]